MNEETKNIIEENISDIQQDKGSVDPEIAKKKAKKKKRRREREKMKKDLIRYKRLLLLQRIIIAAMFVVLILILLVRISSGRVKGTPLDTSVIVDQDICFKVNSVKDLTGGFDSLKAYIEDNYIKYLNRAYILIGTYPDCEYYKISPNVARNEFDWSKDFYVNSGGLYYSYFKDGEDKGRVGIDVSEFQGDINWPDVKAAGVDVAIVRVAYRGYGTGEIHEDSKAGANLSGASEAGLDVGAYFFSSAISKEEGIEEANYLLEKIKGCDIKQPLIIDTEYIAEDSEARSNVISVEDRTAAVVGFCETVEAAGYTPMIYAGRDQFIKYLDVDQIGKWDFWLAAYDTPVFPYHTEGYQYSQYGYVNGVPTQVDLNVWMR